MLYVPVQSYLYKPTRAIPTYELYPYMNLIPVCALQLAESSYVAAPSFQLQLQYDLHGRERERERGCGGPYLGRK